jgi:hypothetical protein
MPMTCLFWDPLIISTTLCVSDVWQSAGYKTSAGYLNLTGSVTASICQVIS